MTSEVDADLEAPAEWMDVAEIRYMACSDSRIFSGAFAFTTYW